MSGLQSARRFIVSKHVWVAASCKSLGWPRAGGARPTLQPPAQGKSEITRLPPHLTVQMVRFFYKVDVQQKAKILRKARRRRAPAECPCTTLPPGGVPPGTRWLRARVVCTCTGAPGEEKNPDPNMAGSPAVLPVESSRGRSCAGRLPAGARRVRVLLGGAEEGAGGPARGCARGR